MEFGFDYVKSGSPSSSQFIMSTIINWDALGVHPSIIGENSRRIKDRLEPTLEMLSSDPVAIVAYGPTLKDTWPELKDYKYIVTCSGAHKFLLDRGIVPTYHLDSDLREHKALMLGDPHPLTTYLIASCCHPKYFDKLDRFHVKLWHILFENEDAYAEIPSGDWIMTGGNTIGPRAVKITRLLGFTNLHLYGFDACGGHADKHSNPQPDDRFRVVRCDGKSFNTTEHLFIHMNVSFKDFQTIPNAQFSFHGDGLLQNVARKWKYEYRPGYPLAVVKDD